MSKRDGRQQGPQNHGEGQHGSKTREAILDELQSGAEKNQSADTPMTSKEADAYGRPVKGHHRLEEDREQHDQAEKNSEANEHERR